MLEKKKTKVKKTIYPKEEIKKNVDKSILKIDKKNILLIGKGKSFEESMADAFEKLKIISYNISNNLLIQMEVQDVILKKYEILKNKIIQFGKDNHNVELDIEIKYKIIKFTKDKNNYNGT